MKVYNYERCSFKSKVIMFAQQKVNKFLIAAERSEAAHYSWHVVVYNKHTCREVSPGLDAPRVAASMFGFYHMPFR